MNVHNPLILRISILLVAALAAGSTEAQLAGYLSAQASNNVFTPTKPCRVIDTRIGQGISSVLVPGVTRNLILRGKCSIPGLTTDGGLENNVAVAVAINIAAVSPSGFGHIVAWPANRTAPTASVLNYSPGVNLANGVIVPMCDQTDALPCQSGDISFVAAVSSTHLVVDVTGYYEKPTLPHPGKRHGAGPGADSFLCARPGDISTRFGLTSNMTTWANAAFACPAGSYVCKTNQLGPCNTSRPASTCDGMKCDGTCYATAAGGFQSGWTANQSATNLWAGFAVDEDGGLWNYRVCETLPVWCCTDF